MLAICCLVDNKKGYDD